MKTDAWMPLYIGDYLADTSRFSTEQHGAYLLLLMDYWRNGPPPDDEAVLASIAKLPVAQWRRIAPLLRLKFTVDGGAWIHKRVEAERQKAAGVSSKRREAGKAGAGKRWGKQDGNAMANAIANASQTDRQSQSQSQEESTVLRPVERAPRRPAPNCPEGVDSQTWADWLSLRKAKRAPVNETVIAGAATEAGKAGMSLDAFLRVWCMRGSQGLSAEWIKPAERAAANDRIGRQLTTAGLMLASAAPSKPVSRPLETIDVTARYLPT